MQQIAGVPILSLKDVTKTFGAKKAVDQLTIEVYKGEIVGFLGPNGAGKTTTIRMILDVLRPTKGKVLLFGEDARHASSVHRRIGYLSGDMVMDADLTGEQYLHFIDRIFGHGHYGYAQELSVLIEATLSTKIGNYSRGNRQKIGLIAALMHRPELLILDEPTSGFDPLVQEKFAALIREYRDNGGTVFMSSHILAEAQKLCDRVVFIKDGSLAGSKTIEELNQASTKTVTITTTHSHIAALKASSKKLAGLRQISSTETVVTFKFDGDIHKMLGFFATQNITDITIEEPELEEIFMGYYEHDKTGVK